MTKRKCLKCDQEFEARDKCRGPHKHVYCSSRCRSQAGSIRNYHRRNVTTEDHWRYGLKKNYGMTPKDYYEIEANQKNKCAICSMKSKLFVDHCHSTGNIRGLLCYHCNFAIGHFNESIDNLKNAIKYLKKEPCLAGKKVKKSKKGK